MHVFFDVNQFMKKIIMTALCILVALLGIAQQQDPPLKFTHLEGNFYTYVSYGTYNGKSYPANAMYLVTKAGIVLFDTPWDSVYYQPLLDSLWARHHQKAIMCIATHFHTDRTGGLKYFAGKGIKTYTTKQTDSLCIIHHENRAESLIPKDTTFAIGGYTFQTYFGGAGHAPDNIVIWFPQSRILYGGCLIKSVRDKDLGNLGDANVNEWANTLRRIQKKFPHPAYVIVGHNDWRNLNSIQHTINMATAYLKAHR